jgi:hypothetical protein
VSLILPRDPEARLLLMMDLGRWGCEGHFFTSGKRGGMEECLGNTR